MRGFRMAAVAALTLLAAGTAVAQVGPQTHIRKARKPNVLVEPAPLPFLLRGITLTDAQKSELKTLQLSQATARRHTPLLTIDERMLLRTARAKGDTVAVGRLQRKRFDRLAINDLRDFAVVRTLMKPEQRGQFDRNLAAINAARHR